MKKYPGFTGASALLPVRQYFERTEEFRAPRRGEFYLSGAVPEVYLATNDLSSAYHIMQPCAEPPRTVEINGFRYRLEGAA